MDLDVSQLYGGTSGLDFGPYTCPSGQYITEFVGNSDKNINSIKGVCSDGTELPLAGGNGPNIFSKVSQDGWEAIDGKYNVAMPEIAWMVPNQDIYITNFLGVGPSGGTTFHHSCPAGKKIVGYSGKAGGSGKSAPIEALSFRCGYDDQYCVNNLESPYCKSFNVPKDILNKACAKSMTETCINRKSELDESMMVNYCSTHANDSICSCYAPVPSFIEPSIAGLQQCWNNKCATYGYKPPSMRSSSCPSITICKQNITAEGENLLASNVIKQDCHPTVINIPDKPTDKHASGGSGNGSLNDNTQNFVPPPKPDDVPKKSHNIYIILFVLIIVMILLYYYFDNDTLNLNKYKT